MSRADAALVAGVAMVPFAKPGRSARYPELGTAAARAALTDAGLAMGDVQQAYVSYVYGDSTCGQRALYPLEPHGIPIVNVNNNCASGSTALFLARQAVENGVADCVLVLGFEQMPAGPLAFAFGDWPNPLQPHLDAMAMLQGRAAGTPVAAEIFGGAGREYQQKYGATALTFAKVALKARRHAEHNPNAVFRTPLTLDEILASPCVFEPLTRLQCCPPTCGAAAAVLCSAEFARRRAIASRVSIAGQAMATDRASTFVAPTMMTIAGYDMTRYAAAAAYNAAGLGPEDVSVVELHDCFTTNEVLSYEGLGLVAEGEAARLIEDGDNTYGGRFVINPSGGLLSKGHPLGATGVAQCAELVWQLRGHAGARQVEGAKVALQHNLGLGGACVVTLYRA